MISGEVKRLLETDGGCRPLLLGRNDDKGDNRHEGLGGWSFQSFATPGANVHRFHVAGIVRPPLIFSSYRHGEVVYRIQSRTLFAGADGRREGVLLGAIRPLDNPALDPGNFPPAAATGVLARVERATPDAGDAAIAFSKAEYPVHANPFWDASLNSGKGVIHLRKYMKDHRYFGGADRIDFACILLGANDCFGVMVGTEEQTQIRLNDIVRNARKLVRGIQDPVYGYPDCRVILALTPMGCNSPDAYVRNYGAQYPQVSMARYESIVRTLWDLLIREFDGTPDWPGVRLSINGLMTDRDKGYPKREILIAGVKTMEHSNATHINAIGCRQCADAYYSVLRGWLDEHAAGGR